jgi:hypothetical protein
MPRRLTLAVLVACLGAALVPASSQAFLTGIGDQQGSMFQSAAYQALHNTPIVRYIAPYDAMKGGIAQDRVNAQDFLTRAHDAGKRILVAFYHSRKSPNKMPSVRNYTAAVKAFRRAFPYVKEFQAWNEANRGNVPGAFKSPTPKQAADYYKALKHVCRGCKITALDLLDQNNIRPSLAYLAKFKRLVRPTPRLWGLHNYSDTNRFRNKGTKAFLKAVPGQVWLTETGGIVKFGSGFPGGAAGEARAARALDFMFRLARSNSRIKRLYIFQWTGAGPNVRFDAGLTDADGQTPRPGYFVVQKHLNG